MTTTTTTVIPAAGGAVIGEGDARARTVAARLLALAGGADRVSVSQADLAAASGLSVRSLRRVMDRLVGAGWVGVARPATTTAPASYTVGALREAGIAPAGPAPSPATAGGPRVLSEAEARSPLGRLTPGERVLVDPSLLEGGENIRRDLRVTDGLVGTVRALGVLKDLHVYPTPTGLVVLDGHRRLDAALRAGLDTVPALVVAVDDEHARVERQLVSNDEHARTLPVERAEAIRQLVLLGVPRRDITRRTGAPSAEIDAAQAVAAAPQAVRDLGRTSPLLDLVTLGRLADLADVAGADAAQRAAQSISRDPAQADHVIERARRDAANTAARDEAAAALAATGVTVIDIRDVREGVRELVMLVDGDGRTITPSDHASCPGHAAYMVVDWSADDQDGVHSYKPVYVCTQWAAQGHRDFHSRSGAQSEQDAEQRARVRRSNMALDAANAVRRTWIRDVLLGRPRPPVEGVAAYELRVARWAHANVSQVARDNGLERIGVDPDSLVEPATPLEAARALLALHLALMEGAIEKTAWRPGAHGDVYLRMVREHLGALTAWGYAPAPIEKQIMTSTTDEGDADTGAAAEGGEAA